MVDEDVSRQALEIAMDNMMKKFGGELIKVSIRGEIDDDIKELNDAELKKDIRPTDATATDGWEERCVAAWKKYLIPLYTPRSEEFANKAKENFDEGFPEWCPSGFMEKTEYDKLMESWPYPNVVPITFEEADVNSDGKLVKDECWKVAGMS